MKANQVVALSFLLPLLAFITNLPLAFSDDVPTAVLDVMQNTVETDRQYYILPLIRGPQGGGLKLAKTGDSDCPLTVLQDNSELFRGRSVKFIQAGDNTTVLTGTDLDIEFVNKPECAVSREWSVFLDLKVFVPSVVIGYEDGIFSGKFQIRKYRAGYKLVFCFSREERCVDIGRFDAENGEDGKRLILDAPDPFNVVFVEAFEDTEVIKSVVV